MIDEKIFPDVEIARHVRLARIIQTKARGEQHHISVAAKHWTRGAGTGDASANGAIETLHAFGVGEVILHRAVDAGHGIEITGEPAVVLGDEFLNKPCACGRRSAGEFGPRFFGARAAGSDGFAAADLEHGSVEIEYVGIDFQARSGNRVAQSLRGFGVEFRKAEIEAAERGIRKEEIDKLAGGFFLGGAPIVDGVENRNARWMVIEHERTIGAERLFELGERESGIDGEERSGGVDGFEHHVGTAAAAHAVAEDAQNVAGFGGLASLNANHFLFAAEAVELAGLRKIADDQFQILGLLQRFVGPRGLIAVRDYVAGERGQ